MRPVSLTAEELGNLPDAVVRQLDSRELVAIQRLTQLLTQHAAASAPPPPQPFHSRVVDTAEAQEARQASQYADGGVSYPGFVDLPKEQIQR